MADQKISDLSNASTPDGTEIFPVVQTGFNLKATLNQVKAFVKAGLTKSDVGLSSVDNTNDLDKPISTATQAALDDLDAEKQPIDADLTAIAALGFSAISFLKKTAANTWALDTATYLPLSGGTMTGDLTLNADPTIALHAATKQYVDGLVVGLWDDRGTFSAAGGSYPSSGGSGTAGAILKGDIWTISVAGTLPTGQVVEVGDTVRALTDTPGNTQGNWAIGQNNIGYTPITNVLNSAQILIGSAGNVATAVAMTGDISISNTGVTAYAGIVPVAKGGTGTTTAFTAGSIVFAGASGVYSQNNANIFWDNTNNRLRVNNSGSTSFVAPQTGTLLHFISESSTFNGRVTLDSYVDTQSTGSIVQGRTARGTIASPSAATADQVLAAFGGDGYGATGFHGNSVGSITVRAEATMTDTSAPTYITISTTPSASTTSVEALRVNSGQDILFGGGTLTTATRYDFRGSASSTTLLRVANSSNNAAFRVQSVAGEILMGTGSSTYIGPGTLGSLGITGTGVVLRASNSGGFHTLISGSNMNTSSQIDQTTTAGPMVAVSSTTGFWMRMRPSFSNTTTQTSVVYSWLSMSPTIDCQGGSTTIRAIDYNPTLTNVTGVTHYGITVRATAALNGFGTGTPTGTMHVVGTTILDGSVTLPTAGNGILIKEGTNATMGLSTLVGGTVTVSTTKVTASSRIHLTSQADGGTPGFVRITARTGGTSFTITSSNASDTSSIAWIIIEPA